MGGERKLLEQAAKACSYEHLRYCKTHMAMVPEPEGEEILPFSMWNPINHDGDRYKLAMQMRMCIDFNTGHVIVDVDGHEVEARFQPGDSEGAAYAIVRVAAEIGKAMP